jgi:uncharacterized membrane protein
MNKQTFLETLEKGLKNKQVSDISDILEDYQEYFERQLALGKKEEDIASSLGNLDSIILDYADIQSGNKKKWFELVTISFIALPMLIMSYGLWISFAATSLAFWGVAVYLTFSIQSLSFMPMIPLIPKIFFILSAFVSCIFMFSLSVRYYGVLKSMTKQYVVKQSIRIGEYKQSPIYIKIFNVSFWMMIALLFITYAVSALVAKSFEFWHVWEWFQ